MKFLGIIYMIIIGVAVLRPTLPRPCSPSPPKTLEEAISFIQKLDENQKRLEQEIKEIYRLIVENNDDIPITYRPEVIEWLRKLNQKDKKKSAPIVVSTPCIRFIRFPKHWDLGHQFQGIHPGLIVKYTKDFTRALVFPLSHAKQYSEHVIPIRLPKDKGKTSYILVDQFQNICSGNIGPAIIGALHEDMWSEIYKDYPFLNISRNSVLYT